MTTGRWTPGIKCHFPHRSRRLQCAVESLIIWCSWITQLLRYTDFFFFFFWFFFLLLPWLFKTFCWEEYIFCPVENASNILMMRGRLCNVFVIQVFPKGYIGFLITLTTAEADRRPQRSVSYSLLHNDLPHDKHADCWRASNSPRKTFSMRDLSKKEPTQLTWSSVLRKDFILFGLIYLVEN